MTTQTNTAGVAPADDAAAPATVLHLILCALRCWTERVCDTLLEVALDMAEESEAEDSHGKDRRLIPALESVLDSRKRGYPDSALWTLETALKSLVTPCEVPRSLASVDEESVSVQYVLTPDGDVQRFTCPLSEAVRRVGKPAAGVANMRIKGQLESHPMVVAEITSAGKLPEECEALAERLATLGKLSVSDYDGGWRSRALDMGRKLLAAASKGSTSEVRATLREAGAVLAQSGSGLAKRIHSAFVGMLTNHPEAVAEIGAGEVLSRVRHAVLAKLREQWKAAAAQAWEFDDENERWYPANVGPGCPITPAGPIYSVPGPFEAPSTTESQQRFNRASRQARERNTIERRGAAVLFEAVRLAQVEYGRPAPVATPYTLLAPDKEMGGPELVWYRIDGRYELLGRQHNAHVRARLVELNAVRAATLQLLSEDYPALVGVQALVGLPCMCPLCGHELLAEVHNEYLCAGCIMGGALN